MANTGTSEMLLTTYNFALEIDGLAISFFKEASGLSAEVEVIEHQVVGEKGKQVTQKIAGHSSTGEITLKKSLDATTDLFDWFNQVRQGDYENYRKNGAVIMYDPLGEAKASWKFVNGWPKSWSASDLDAGADDVSIEELVITHEGLDWAK